MRAETGRDGDLRLRVGVIASDTRFNEAEGQALRLVRSKEIEKRTCHLVNQDICNSLGDVFPCFDDQFVMDEIDEVGWKLFLPESAVNTRNCKHL